MACSGPVRHVPSAFGLRGVLDLLGSRYSMSFVLVRNTCVHDVSTSTTCADDEPFFPLTRSPYRRIISIQELRDDTANCVAWSSTTPFAITGYKTNKKRKKATATTTTTTNTTTTTPATTRGPQTLLYCKCCCQRQAEPNVEAGDSCPAVATNFDMCQ